MAGRTGEATDGRLSDAQKVAALDSLARAANFIASDGYTVARTLLAGVMAAIQPISDAAVAGRRDAAFPPRDGNRTEAVRT